MKLSGYKKDYQELSGLASTACRQLAFGGIALIWVFKNNDGLLITLPNSLMIPAGFLALSLTCDLLQYVFAAIIWGTFHRYNEKKKSNTEDDPLILAPFYFNIPANTCFVLKIASVTTAYFFIIKHIWCAIKFV